MSNQSIPNLIAHEIQVTEGIQLSDDSKAHIERLVAELVRERDHWRNKHFEKFWK